MRLLAQHGFLLFMKEQNLRCPLRREDSGINWCTEFAFLHRNCRRNLHLNQPFHHNYPPHLP